MHHGIVYEEIYLGKFDINNKGLKDRHYTSNNISNMLNSCKHCSLCITESQVFICILKTHLGNNKTIILLPLKFI